MMVDKDEHCVTEDGSQRVLLRLPVPDRLVLLNTIRTNVVDRADHHQEKHDDARVGRKDLQVL